jgi:hypothetical protein
MPSRRILFSDFIRVNTRLRGAGLRSELTCPQRERHALGVVEVVRRVADRSPIRLGEIINPTPERRRLAAGFDLRARSSSAEFLNCATYTQRISARPSCAERSFDHARRKITNGE